MKPTNSPTQGQPNPRKMRLKVAFGPLSPSQHNDLVVAWDWFFFMKQTAYKKPNPTTPSTNTLILQVRQLWVRPIEWLTLNELCMLLDSTRYGGLCKGGGGERRSVVLIVSCLLFYSVARKVAKSCGTHGRGKEPTLLYTAVRRYTYAVRFIDAVCTLKVSLVPRGVSQHFPRVSDTNKRCTWMYHQVLVLQEQPGETAVVRIRHQAVSGSTMLMRRLYQSWPTKHTR